MTQKISLGFHPTIYPDPDLGKGVSDSGSRSPPSMEDRERAYEATSWLIARYDLLSYRIATAVSNDQFLVQLRKETRKCTWGQLHTLADLFGMSYKDFVQVHNLQPEYYPDIEAKITESDFSKK